MRRGKAARRRARHLYLQSSCALAALIAGSMTLTVQAQTSAACDPSAPSCQKEIAAATPPLPPQKPSVQIETVTVTADRLSLLGVASSASEGVVDDQEIQLTPAYRPGQVLETVPGLIVTLHSGEGKANQFLMRGYNLDHGTDLATFVDDMPINQPTHAHGQGYTDLNFMIPELADQITYTKGPYYADVGDFGSVGSVRLSYRDSIPDEASVTAGSFGYERLFAAGSQPLGAGELLAGGEVQHYDGPFVQPDDARKVNLVLRYSQDMGASDFSLTGMIYHQLWTNTTDIPERAITEGLVPNRFGTLDPTDGGNAVRGSLSAEYHSSLDVGQLSASAFYIFNELHLYNDFTHYLVDPVHGDQEDQFENRSVLGGSVDYTVSLPLGDIPNEIKTGIFERYDLLGVGRLPSEGRQPLFGQEDIDPASFSDSDRVNLFASAAYVKATTHWTPWLRTVLGLREDFQDGTDVDAIAALHETDSYTNGGTKLQSLLQPKGSLIYTPMDELEFYLSAGEGFHSADLRGVDQDRSVDLGLPNTPLLAKQVGEEIGVRAAPRKYFTFTIALYDLWQQSETIIDPDVGQDVAGPGSRRYGYEVNATYQFTNWLEFYGSYSGNHARFTQPFDDGTGHLGTYITDAPVAQGSFALYLQNLGPWSGGLNYRYLGNYPLSSGPCVNSAAVHDFPGVATSCLNAPTALGQVNGKGFGQLNMDVHYALVSGWGASLGIYNLLNTKAAAAEFWYVDRLKSEIDTYPDGRADIHEHPLEPLMLRISISKQFG
jgi:hypothetical protein